MEKTDSNLLEPGHAIGSYTIVRHLGSGAFGAVYEARKRPIDKQIALKLLHRDKALDTNVVARFMQEARAAASLKHPHIVDVDDVGVLDGTPFLAMEFLEGESLTARLAREGVFGVAGALELLLPIFSAVAAVHERGIVHRDLKPDNIHLWRPLAGRVHPKLLDFGIAKVREGHQGASLTKIGAVMGTPKYMSVEQWAGSKYATAQSDIWALGVILFECLTGRLPFDGEELPVLITRVSLEPPMSMRSIDPSLPADLEAVVMKALEKKPADRHSTVRAFGRELLPFAHSTTVALWQSEFGGAQPLGALDTIDASNGHNREVTAPNTAVPDTLSKSAKEVVVPAQKPLNRRAVAAVVLGASLTLIASLSAFVLTRDNAYTRSVSAQRPTVVPTPQRPLVVTPTPPVASVRESALVLPAPAQTPVQAVDAGAVNAPAGTHSVRTRHRRRGENLNTNGAAPTVSLPAVSAPAHTAQTTPII